MTLAEAVNTIRDLSFDKYTTPCFFIQGPARYYMFIDASALVIKKLEDDNTTWTTKTTIDFFPVVDGPSITLKQVVDQLISSSENYSISYGPAFIDKEVATSLVQLNQRSISEVSAMYRSYFFSDTYIVNNFIRYYFLIKLGLKCGDVESTDFDQEIQKFGCPRPEHMVIWCAYHAVEERRKYEMAGEFLGNTVFTGSGEGGLVSSYDGNANMTVRVGDVFELSKLPAMDFIEGERINSVGADNVFGDATSFWFRLQMHLRLKLENLFADYGLRPNTVMTGQLNLDAERNWYAYFDNFPYTISPYSREVLSGN